MASNTKITFDKRSIKIEKRRKERSRKTARKMRKLASEGKLFSA